PQTLSAGIPTATPEGPSRQSISRNQADLSRLRAERTNFVDDWLKPLSVAALQDTWSKGVSSTFRQLLGTGLQDEPFVPGDAEIIAALQDALAPRVSNLEQIRALLALLLYQRPHNITELSLDFNVPPRWLLPDLIEFLFLPPQQFSQPGEADRYC